MAKQKGHARARLVESISNHEGALALKLRRAIQRRAAMIEGEPGDDEVPAALRRYVDKVARYAYKVTDEDFEELRATYDTRQIYEITVAVAVGAAEARRQAAANLLRGGQGS